MKEILQDTPNMIKKEINKINNYILNKIKK